MRCKFSFTKSIEDVVLMCTAEYWATQRHEPEEVDLIDVTHQGGSILSLMSPQFIVRIEEAANQHAYEDWASAQEDFLDAKDEIHREYLAERREAA